MSEKITTVSEDVINEYNNGSSKVKKVLKRLFPVKLFQPEIMERINTFKDVCKEMGKNHKDYVCESEDEDEIAANAYRKALLIVKCYNGDTVLDWKDSNQPKYCLRFHLTGSGWALFDVDFWHTHAHCGARLHFAKSEHAQDAWNKFSEIFVKLN